MAKKKTNALHKTDDVFGRFCCGSSISLRHLIAHAIRGRHREMWILLIALKNMHRKDFVHFFSGQVSRRHGLHKEPIILCISGPMSVHINSISVSPHPWKQFTQLIVDALSWSCIHRCAWNRYTERWMLSLWAGEKIWKCQNAIVASRLWIEFVVSRLHTNDTLNERFPCLDQT